MNIESFREYCLSKKGVTESFPFDETTLVFKVLGKMFALTDTEPPFSINLKFSPEELITAREEFPAVTPGYHMNKQHWNSVLVDGSIPEKIILRWTDYSYDLVVAGLPRKTRTLLNDL
jgi:predicted DNA-binding protein (MmcQ/YjbR family)